MDDKPWENEELRNSEEGLPWQEDEILERAARSYKAATGVGCGRISP